uniref:Asparaginase n=1 Tax=viral metagenome TaxID=1070528 RepID=A0A6C0H2Z0_9ZZZZ
MKFLTQEEKQILVFLTTAAIASTVVSIYFGVNIQQENEEVSSKKIHIIHTGGDIDGNFKENYDIQTYKPLIKSADISPKDWNIIANDVGGKYNYYDAFVIICGKDTLVYTASALSFMLENLSKPVVLTDGDVTSALKLASKTKIPEVMIVSQGKLLRGCRSVHKSTDFFSSPNYPFLDNNNSLPIPTENMGIKFVNPKINIVVVKVFPGMTESPLINLIENDIADGVVLEMYGNGKAPTSKNFIDSINRLTKKGVIIVAVSQCDELVKLDVDIRLLEAGVLSGNDMTTPAAYAKLYFLLSNVEDKTLVRQLIEKTFRGEMSVNYPSV